MSLKIKAGIPLERLREFGFAPGSELVLKNAKYAEFFRNREYTLFWWHKFGCKKGVPRMDEYGNPNIHAWANVREGKSRLWFEITPSRSYHAGMNDLDMLTDTIFELAQAGVIELEGTTSV